MSTNGDARGKKAGGSLINQMTILDRRWGPPLMDEPYLQKSVSSIRLDRLRHSHVGDTRPQSFFQSHPCFRYRHDWLIAAL